MNIFKIKREELLAAFAALSLFIALNTLMLAYHYELFTRGGRLGFWTIFHDHFTVSGFDDYTYVTISNWGNFYELYRHPLLALIMYPLYLLNSWLMGLYEFNFTIFIVAVLLVLSSFYSFVFLYRIFREIINVKKTDALLVSALFFSFAYIMLTVMVPDHFAYSMFFLTMTLYIAGKKMKEGKIMKSWQTMIIFFMTSGVTLSNGIKVLLASLFSNGRAFFTRRNLFIAVIFPSLLLLGIYYLQCYYLLWPEEQERKVKWEERFKKDKVFAKAQIEHQKWMSKRRLSPKDHPYLEWVDFSAPRVDAAVENLFGESILLHKHYLLQDTNMTRPIKVRYDNKVNYVVEALIFLLFVIGIWCGRHSRFLGLCMSWFAFDMFLHFVLGFGIIEVYIMAAHWMFVIPISICYLMKTLNGRNLLLMRMLVLMIVAYLAIYNGTLISSYMLNEI